MPEYWPQMVLASWLIARMIVVVALQVQLGTNATPERIGKILSVLIDVAVLSAILYFGGFWK